MFRQNSRLKISCVWPFKWAIEWYIHVVLFIMLYKVALTFTSVDESPVLCDHSNESYWAVLSCGAAQLVLTWVNRFRWKTYCNVWWLQLFINELPKWNLELLNSLRFVKTKGLNYSPNSVKYGYFHYFPLLSHLFTNLAHLWSGHRHVCLIFQTHYCFSWGKIHWTLIIVIYYMANWCMMNWSFLIGSLSGPNFAVRTAHKLISPNSCYESLNKRKLF